jgi:hypothetical protein
LKRLLRVVYLWLLEKNSKFLREALNIKICRLAIFLKKKKSKKYLKFKRFLLVQRKRASAHDSAFSLSWNYRFQGTRTNNCCPESHQL